MGILTTIALTAAAVGVAATVNASNQAGKAAFARQRASKVQAKRRQMAAVRSNILASARARASAQATGAAQSSGLSGGLGSGRSQLGAELGFGTQMSGLSAQISNFEQNAQRSSMIAGLGFQAAGFAMSPQGSSLLKKVKER
jgi:hypothetical protein